MLPGGESITVVRTTVNPVGDETIGASHVLSSVLLAPITSTESEEPDSDVVTEGFTIYSYEPNADVKSTDRLMIRGNEYRVRGEINTWLTTGSVFEAVRVRG
jgi:hypothetical protein